MKKLFFFSTFILVLSLIGISAPNKKSSCECLNNPSKNDGICTAYSSSHPTRSGYYCAQTGGNKDCYNTQCTDSTPID